MAITRREFLQYSAATGAGILFGVFDLKPIVAYAQANPPQWTSEAFNICPYCGCGCGLIVCKNASGQITYVQGDPDHPINKGALCSKGENAGQLNHIEGYIRPAGIPDTDKYGTKYKADDSERVIKPLKRAAGDSNWQVISWSQAISEIAGLIKTERDNSLNYTVEDGVLKSCRLDTIAALGTAKDTNEECYLYTKLMRSLGITYLDHCARLCHSSSVPALAESFGRGAMTQHFIDVKNADVIMIIGSNAAECHPMLCKWIAEARNPNNPITQGKTKLISVDARFTRTSSKADIYAKMRSGTDIAFIGGMIKYAIDHGLYNEKYVKECTNALFKVHADFKTCAENNGVFSGLTGGTWDSIVQATLDASYDKATHDYDYGDQPWSANNPYSLGDIVRPSTATGYHYECTVAGTSGDTEPTWPTTVGGTVNDGSVTWTCIYKRPKLADNLNDPNCVFQKLKKQFDGYTIERVCEITGTDPDVYEQICQTFCSTYPDDKSATICYAMGTTQHTVGVQNIRAYAILQLLLGNVGVAGGGINAMRGQDNVQGSTDQAILFHILPGYLRQPDVNDTSLSTWINKFQAPNMTIEPTHSYTIRGGTTPKDPKSMYWWQNANKYITSLVKAWWPTEDYTVAFNYIPKKQAGKDQSILSIFDAMYNDELKGFICDGENPAVSDADSRHVRHALRELDWMVCIDPFETETAAFWKVDLDGNPLTPGQMASIGTTVYLLPCAVSIEKYGSRSNSGRWIQWHFKGGNPPGEAKPDIEIITLLGQKIQQLYGASTDPEDQPIVKLSWPCLNYNSSDDLTSNAFAEKVAKEMNGYNMSGSTPGTLVNGFANLKADGTTACGNWLHCGSFVETANLDSFENANLSMFASTVGNRMSRQYPIDVPNGGLTADPLYKNIGLHSYWTFSWPVNRRIIYNRASFYQSDKDATHLAGDPLAPNKHVLRWDTTQNKLVGDVIDGGSATSIGDWYPFIMQKEGHGHLFGGWGIKDGPFPWHYEPLESPIPYPSWLGDGTYRVNPIVHNFRPRGAIYAAHNGGNDSSYPIFATSYRLTEHWHSGSMTRNLPRLNELMPEPFVEMSEELADELGIANGELVNIYSARNPKGVAPPVQMKACVTKRFKPYQLGAKTVHHVGFVWHWGYMTINPGVSANILTVFIGDANTYIPESKCFRVKIEKIS